MHHFVEGNMSIPDRADVGGAEDVGVQGMWGLGGSHWLEAAGPGHRHPQEQPWGTGPAFPTPYPLRSVVWESGGARATW